MCGVGVQERVIRFDVEVGRYSSIEALDEGSVLWVSKRPVASTEEDEDEELGERVLCDIEGG